MSASTSVRLVPRRWLRLPRHSARLRLTLMYSGLFLLLGTAVIVLMFVLVRNSTSVSVAQAVPSGSGGDVRRQVVSVGPSVVEGIVNGTPVRALCGKVWVPGRDPKKYPLCPTCKEIAEAQGWQVPAG